MVYDFSQDDFLEMNQVTNEEVQDKYCYPATLAHVLGPSTKMFLQNYSRLLLTLFFLKYKLKTTQRVNCDTFYPFVEKLNTILQLFFYIHS